MEAENIRKRPTKLNNPPMIKDLKQIKMIKDIQQLNIPQLAKVEVFQKELNR